MGLCQVEDDVVTCETVKEEKCQELTAGYTSEQKCSNWPKEVNYSVFFK
jgi:hypothetical protein